MNTQKVPWSFPESDFGLDIYRDSSEDLEYHNEIYDEWGTVHLEYHDDDDDESEETKRWWRGRDTHDGTATEWMDRDDAIEAMSTRVNELEGL